MTRDLPARTVLFGLFFWVLVGTSSEGLAQERCLEFRASADTLGHFQDPEMLESSGLVVSRKNPGVIWTHNDSGDTARLFASTVDGRALGVWTLDGTVAIDWEDIGLARCEDGAMECILIADTGNNDNNRTDLAVLRVREPSVDLAVASPVAGTLSGVEVFPFSYPDGSWDCESIMSHPLTGDVFLVSKVLSGASGLYRFPSFVAGAPVVLERLSEQTLGNIPLVEQSTTGADFSPDGQRFVVRTYVHLHEFAVGADGDVGAAFARESEDVRVQEEQQGEAVAYGADGQSVWTTSEGTSAPIHAYPCARFGEEVVDEPAPEGVDEQAPELVEADAPADAPADPVAELNDALPKTKNEASRGCCRATQVSPSGDGALAPFSLFLLLGLAVRRLG